MASHHDVPNVELSHVLTLKDDMHSLANGESEMINGRGTWGSLREPLYGGASGVSGGGTGVRMDGARGTLRRWADSFRRDPKGRMTPKNAFVGGLGMDLGDGREHQGRNYYDLRAANYRTAHPLLAKELKGRHLQMIAIGGSIGM